MVLCSEARPQGRMEDGCDAPFAVLLTYNDGFKATILFLNGFVSMIACEHSKLSLRSARLLCVLLRLTADFARQQTRRACAAARWRPASSSSPEAPPAWSTSPTRSSSTSS